jgi:hypothetical protein
MCKLENDCNMLEQISEIRQQVKEIHDMLVGSKYHKGDGVLDRLARLEKTKNRVFYFIGTITGAALVIGYVLGKLKLF